jgi:type IV secretory pathway TraG/TraD family ATPase VirD4
MVFQSISQLDSKYGHSADAVKGGIGSYLVYAGADYSTAKSISDIMGKRVLIERNHFTDVEQRYQELLLLAPDKIRTLASNQAVFIAKNYHPVIIDFVPFYKHFSFTMATKTKPCELPDNRASDRVNFVEI